MTAGIRVAISALIVVVLAAAFWMLALGPKRQEARDLGKEVESLESTVAQHRQEAAAAAHARKSFPADYQQLVLLGKAVPADDDTASLLVELNRISEKAGVRFQDITLNTSEGGAAPPPTPAPAPAPEGEGGSEATPASTPAPAPATEAAAATMPLGATVGSAGLPVMPYTLTFTGSFFQIADFIKGIDSLVKTGGSKVVANGRLVTIDSFSLEGASRGFPRLEASFAITTYLTPADQGVTAGATPAAPAPSTAVPTSTTTGAP